jgi:hypothetical protein
MTTTNVDKKDETFRLLRRQGRVFLRFDGSATEAAVKVAWARPLSARGRDVAFIDEKKNVIAMADQIERLDAESQVIAREEIAERYLLARILRVHETQTRFGVRYWDVETDRGRQRFAVKDPNRSVIAQSDDRMTVRDTLGNSYEIESLKGLDRKSQEEVEKVL